MKIAISGAGGYIGKEVVAHALNQGHAVVALVRDKYPREWDELENLVVKPCDLLEGAAALDNVLPGCDALIHLAAIMNGNDQYTKTLEATKNVLDAMDRAEVKRLVNVSSIAVLDYVRQLPMSTIDEMVPPASSDQDLGCYALMKRDQEELCKSWRGGGKTLIQLRPGIVYDKGNLSNYHVGFKFLAVKHEGKVPVVHVKNVSAAAVTAAGNELDDKILHLTNDELPTQTQYIAKLKSNGNIGLIFPLQWQLFSFIMLLFRILFSIFGKVPDSFRRNSVAARQKPFKYSNNNAKELLQWQPRASLED